MKKIIKSLGVATLLSTSLMANSVLDDSSLGVKLGTLGIGAEYTKKYSDNIDARFGINSYNYSTSGEESSIEYDIDLKLQTITAIADYYPTDGGFKLSGGLFVNNNEFEFNGKAKGGTYNINGTTYTATDVGSLKGDVDFNTISPYIGMGYSSRTKSNEWAFNMDFGVMYQGSPEANLNVTCGSSLSAAQCNTLKSNVQSEQQQLQDEIDGYKWYPVLSFGTSYKF
jgi:hypothetical protein